MVWQKRGQVKPCQCHIAIRQMNERHFKLSKPWIKKKKLPQFLAPNIQHRGSDDRAALILCRSRMPSVALVLGFLVPCAAQTLCFPDGIPQNELLSCGFLCLRVLQVLREIRPNTSNKRDLWPITLFRVFVGKPMQTCKALSDLRAQGDQETTSTQDLQVGTDPTVFFTNALPKFLKREWLFMLTKTSEMRLLGDHFSFFTMRKPC